MTEISRWLFFCLLTCWLIDYLLQVKSWLSKKMKTVFSVPASKMFYITEHRLVFDS